VLKNNSPFLGKFLVNNTILANFLPNDQFLREQSTIFSSKIKFWPKIIFEIDFPKIKIYKIFTTVETYK